MFANSSSACLTEGAPPTTFRCVFYLEASHRAQWAFFTLTRTLKMLRQTKRKGLSYFSHRGISFWPLLVRRSLSFGGSPIHGLLFHLLLEISHGQYSLSRSQPCMQKTKQYTVREIAPSYQSTAALNLISATPVITYCSCTKYCNQREIIYKRFLWLLR